MDVFREILQSLSNSKLRTALTGLAVAWGIFMLIVLLGMSRGVVNAFNSNFMSQHSNTASVWGGFTTAPHGGYRQGRAIRLEDKDIPVVENHGIRGVSLAIPAVNGGGIVATQRDYVGAEYVGVYPEAADFNGINMTFGRFINDADLKQQRKVMVLSSKNADILFPSAAEAVGRTVKVNNLVFTVIGVYDDRWRTTMYIPYTTAVALNGHSNRINEITVEMENVTTEADGDRVEQGVRSALASAHDFDPNDRGAIWIWNRLSQHLKGQQGLSILNWAVWLIGLFTLLSGIVGVSNIMFVSVRERTHEIGIRRAIGAKPRSILTQVVLESVVITTLFGYIGIVMGIGVTELLSMAFANTEAIKDPTVNISIAVYVTLVLIVAGALAGLFPALNALKVKPVEALRDE